MSNNCLPIATFRTAIIEAVKAYQVVIITAETGAGKSTQVPQYLLDEGYTFVVTQPRRLAARTVAERVAMEYGTPFGGVIGYQTGYERKFSKATRCLFATDGLEVMRELGGTNGYQLLVMDEVHERNIHIDTLMAWARIKIATDPTFKLVLMSATIDAERLSQYYNGAPIISVPGRTFPVEERPAAGVSLEADAVSLLREGHDVLVFQPGKGEITQTVGRLQELGVNAELLPLHGELTPEEQQKCFQSYTRPKCVVSTNVAQTSVTIPGITAVVDSGMERRTELVDGVEGLYRKAISHADSAQRKGRAGRTKAGIYIDWCPTAWGDRLEFPKPEILRVRLDQTVLRLAEAGFDMEALCFLDQPEMHKIIDAKRALRALGCMDEAGKVTSIGKLVAKLPVSVQHARMIVEADRIGVVDDVITIAAILDQGGINARVCQECRRYNHKSCTCWQGLVPGETTSDALAQLALYRVAENLTRNDMMAQGIFAKAFCMAKEKRRHLEKSLRGKVKFGSSGNRENILRSVCAGMVDHLYVSAYGTYQSGNGIDRQLARESVVCGGKWVVGLPLDLDIQTRRGPTVLRLVRMATRVDPTWLAEIAPHLSKVKEGLLPRYDSDLDEVVSTVEIWFNNLMIGSFTEQSPSHPEAARLRREGRNESQWRNWANKPEIAVPSSLEDLSVVPEIVECVYGYDVESGEPLMAYGTLAAGYRTFIYSSYATIDVQWTRDRHAAEKTRKETKRLHDAIVAERVRREEEAAKADELFGELVAVREEVSILLDKYVQDDAIDPGLYFNLQSCDSVLRAYDREDLGLPHVSVQLDPWLTEARGLIARVKQAADETYATSSGVSEDSLADLVAKFNRQ